jgi:hypothetical protein
VKFFNDVQPSEALNGKLEQLVCQLQHISLHHFANNNDLSNLSGAELRSKLPPMLDCCLLSYTAHDGDTQYHIFDTVFV